MDVDVAGAAEQGIFEVMRLEIGDCVRHVLFAGQERLFPDNLLPSLYARCPLDVAGQVADQQLRPEARNPELRMREVLHAPQGDTYADILFTMIERRDGRPPVTYTTFQARDLGSDTAELFKSSVRDAYERFRPDAMIVGASCTAELIQDDPGGLARALKLPVPVIPLELPAYQRKENWGASETFYQIVRALTAPHVPPPDFKRPKRRAGQVPRCNLLGATALGFRHRDDIQEITALLNRMGVTISVVAPLGATPRI